jgi:hypothetical protein
MTLIHVSLLLLFALPYSICASEKEDNQNNLDDSFINSFIMINISTTPPSSPIKQLTSSPTSSMRQLSPPRPRAHHLTINTHTKKETPALRSPHSSSPFALSDEASPDRSSLSSFDSPCPIDVETPSTPFYAITMNGHKIDAQASPTIFPPTMSLDTPAAHHSSSPSSRNLYLHSPISTQHPSTALPDSMTPLNFAPSHTPSDTSILNSAISITISPIMSVLLMPPGSPTSNTEFPQLARKPLLYIAHPEPPKPLPMSITSNDDNDKARRQKSPTNCMTQCTSCCVISCLAKFFK